MRNTLTTMIRVKWLQNLINPIDIALCFCFSFVGIHRKITTINYEAINCTELTLQFGQGSFSRNFKFTVSKYANPVYGVATICHQFRCLRWGHPSLFHTATSILIWYEMFCMTDISYRRIWMKFINMLSVYAHSGTHRRFNWLSIAVLT